MGYYAQKLLIYILKYTPFNPLPAAKFMSEFFHKNFEFLTGLSRIVKNILGL